MSKKNLIYIGVLILLIGIYLIQNNNKKNYIERSVRFLKADSTTVSKIELSSQEEKIVLEKESGEWKITEPFVAKVEPKKIEDLISKVLPVKTSSIPISENFDSFDQFNISDSAGTSVKFFDSYEEIIDDVYFGKSENYRFCNARKQDSDKVFKIKENIMSKIKVDLNFWRNKNILKIPEAEIKEISVNCPEKFYTLTKMDSTWNYSTTTENKEISKDNNDFAKIISTLKNMNIYIFFDNEFPKFEKDFENPLASIMIYKNNSEKTELKIIEKDSKYIMMIDNKKSHLYKISKGFAESFTKI